MASKAETYRKLAGEALVAAHKSADPEVKLTLTSIAMAYERLAREVEKRDIREEPEPSDQ